MNTYITEKLNRITKILSSDTTLSPESTDIAGEIEMIKMEIEQHISNMPETKQYEAISMSAELAIKNLEIIIELIEDFPYTEKNEQAEVLKEIFSLIEDINY